MAFGVYPAVSLAQARALRDEAKKKLVRDVQLNNGAWIPPHDEYDFA